ncbi:MAG: biotin--[acetyl-CoA-carboxylase] ligase [Nocardioidaceae bacterium]
MLACVNLDLVTVDHPDRPPLDPAAWSGLDPPWRVEVLEQVASTNAALVERARNGAAEGLVLVTEHQTAGRGRLDRGWATPARAALTFSVLLRPVGVPAARWPWLPLLAGVAAAAAVRREGVRAAVKWPNDLLVEGRKLAGILLERVETTAGPAVVLGLGVNVSTTRAELPVPHATSLLLEGGVPVDRGALLAVVLAELAAGYGRWVADAGDPDGGLRASYLAVCETVGRDVRVEVPDGRTVRGRAVGVDGVGRLVVGTGGGEVTLGAGDVVHVGRPDAPP